MTGVSSSMNDMHIEQQNRLLRELRDTSNMTIKFPMLDTSSLRILCFVDTRYYEKARGDAKLGYLICLADVTSACYILKYATSKANRLVRSSSIAEALTLADWFDAAFSIGQNIVHAIRPAIPLLDLMHYEILFKYILADACRLSNMWCRPPRTYAGLWFDLNLKFRSHIYESNPLDGLTKLKTKNVHHMLM